MKSVEEKLNEFFKKAYDNIQGDKKDNSESTGTITISITTLNELKDCFDDLLAYKKIVYLVHQFYECETAIEKNVWGLAPIELSK